MAALQLLENTSTDCGIPAHFPTILYYCHYSGQYG
jgi:uncharacterized protein (UPF0147 family)